MTINHTLMRQQNNTRTTVFANQLPIKHHHPKKLELHAGSPAPYAYNDTYEFPKDYKPWSFNYKGDGLFFGCLLGFGFALYCYNRDYLNKIGRRERRDA